MTLLELMIKEGVEWPRGSYQVHQNTNNTISFHFLSGYMCSEELPMQATDGASSIVTQEQYEAATTSQGHPHAAIMAEYAEVAKTNPKPWEEFEWCRDGREWTTMFSGDAFMTYNQYRRKPRTININGFEVPIPLSGRQKIGSVYWMPVLGCEFAICKMEYRGQKHDDDYVASGIAHSTKEAAELHAKALLSFTKQ